MGTMKRRTNAILLAALLVGIGGVGLGAQEEEVAPEEPAESTLTGCLAAADGQWMITGDEGAHAVVEGAADLEAHSGHEVRLTGTWQEGADGEKVFVADAIEHLGVCGE